MRRLQWTWILLLVIIAALGCATPHTQLSEEEDEPYDYDHEKDMAEYQGMFDRYRALSETVQPDSLTLYEGSLRYLDASVEEAAQPDLFERFDYEFYKQSQVLEGEAAKPLLAILMDPTMFEVYGGPKMCGSFHPDYAMVIPDGGQSHHFLFCTGCHEMAIFTVPEPPTETPSDVVGMDIPQSTYNKLLEILVPLEKARLETRERQRAVDQAK